MRCFATLSLVVMLSCVVYAKTLPVEVSNGTTERTSVPVHALVSMDHVDGYVHACVDADGTMLPAQIELLDDGQAAIWWIVPALDANETVTHTIHLGKQCQSAVFHWIDKPDEYIQLSYGKAPVLSYINIPYDKNDIEGTKKPFHHVYAPQQEFLLTKGVGGLFSHHRGIYFGYNKIDLGDEMVDIWHARDGEHSVHETVLESTAGPVFGSHTVQIDWNDKEGKPFAMEKRHLRAFWQPDGQTLIDFRTALHSLRGDIRLDGDRQHAGVQFRPSQQVADNQEASRYLRPDAWKDLPEDEQINTEEHKDLPWNALKCTIEDQRFTIAYLSHPTNPDNAEMSERLYGRFGEFFPYDLTEDKPLELMYRWWISEGDDATRADVHAKYVDYATPPTVRVLGSE